jgi:crossover junction endodeoxyribonuclease RuvC
LRVLGIDPGSYITGYGVVVKGPGGSLDHVCNGIVSAKRGAPLAERLLLMHRGLLRIISESRPDSVSVESVFFAKNARSAILLGEARGVILLSAASAGLPVFEYPPSSIKQAVTGHGGATKDEVLRMVKMILNPSSDPSSDSADALAAAICHIHSLRPGLRGASRSIHGA